MPMVGSRNGNRVQIAAFKQTPQVLQAFGPALLLALDCSDSLLERSAVHIAHEANSDVRHCQITGDMVHAASVATDYSQRDFCVRPAGCHAEAKVREAR